MIALFELRGDGGISNGLQYVKFFEIVVFISFRVWCFGVSGGEVVIDVELIRLLFGLFKVAMVGLRASSYKGFILRFWNYYYHWSSQLFFLPSFVLFIETGNG